MEEAAERTKTKRGKKGKGKKSKGKRTKNTEDADQIRLQETISSSSLEGGPSLEQLSETSFPPTEEHVDIGAEVPRRSVARSDSELTSIVVVKAEDEPVTVEQSDDEKEIVSEAEKAEARCPIQQAEKAFPPRWKGKFSRLDSGASLADEVKNNTEEPEQINENVMDVSISIQEEQEEDKQIEVEESTIVEDPGKVVEVEVENTQENDELQLKAVSFSDETVGEYDAPKRNPVPDGSEVMEDEALNMQAPEKLKEEDGDHKIDEEKEVAKEDVFEGSDTLPWEMYRYVEKKEREDEDTDFEEYDGQRTGNYYKEAEDLPSLDGFADDLENEKSGLGTKKPPPSLYDNLQQKEMHKYVDELRQGMADEEIASYLAEFERKIEEEIIEIGDISLEDVQEEERRLREEHIAFRQREARVERDTQNEIMMAMEKAKKHVMNLFRQKCKLILMRQEHLMQRDRLLQDRIHRSFRRSENHLLRALAKKMGEVKTMYGDLVFSDGQYEGSKCRRWKVDWIRTPQPIQIKLRCLRGVKNKLPASRYVLMASLYSRLGGHVMKWANLKGQQWGGATLPMNHDGEFFNIELKIDQSVFAVCPSRPDMKAGMILVFELMILRGSVTPTDKVVGWGCFPICDGNFNVAEGKHKAPLLRGSMDPAIDKFETIEKLVASDIDHWLCNLYFEIVKLPKYLAGQKEYEIELQFSSQTSKLLNKEIALTEKPAPSISKDASSGVEKGMPPSIVASTVSIQSSRPPAYSDIYTENNLVSNDDDVKPGPSHAPTDNLTIDVPAVPQRKTSDRTVSPAPSISKLRKISQLSTDVRQRKGSRQPAKVQIPDAEGERPFTVYGSRKVVEEQGVYLGDGESSSDSEYSGDEVYIIGKGGGLKPVEGQPGIYYKVRQSHQGEDEKSKFYTMLPKTPLLAQQRKKKKLTHLEELEQHNYSIKTKWSGKDSMLRKSQRRMRYVWRMMPIELDLWQYKSKEFWSMLLILVLAWWIRMYLHYVGQWIFLVGQLIPINSVQYLPYTVSIHFQNIILRTREEIGVIAMGPFTNIMVLIVMILFCYFFQLLYDRFPNLLSRFIIAYGIQTVLDPFWILVVDTAKGRYINLGGDNPIGDAYKLFYHFSRYFGNGAVTLFISISITLFLYAVTVFCACAILYLYFMRLHNNGRMMDIYWRLHGIETNFFVPYDLEMSNEELAFICRKAEKWRGQEGEQRKVSVYHYTWEEEEVAEEDWENTKPKKKKIPRTETITHISIHTIHLDGLRELHRHFLKLNNGAIVEVFGEVSMPDEAQRTQLTGVPKSNLHGGSFVHGRVNRSYSASSSGSIPATEKERRPSQFLDLPSMVK